jgi:hypothetical protein
MNLLDALKDTNVGGAFLLNQAKEPALVMKLPEDVNFDAQTPIGYGVFEWYQYDPEGAIIRTIVQVYQNIRHLQQPVVSFDTFINPNDDSGRLLLQHMATAPFLWRLAWRNDADLTFLGQKQLRNSSRLSVMDSAPKWRGSGKNSQRLACEPRRSASEQKWIGCTTNL